MFKKIAIIVNPISGGKKNKPGLADYVQNYLVDYYKECVIKYTTKRGDATKYANDLVHRNFDLVIAIGGDGTINETATGLINSNTALAVLPTGSGNGLARSLKIPLDIKSACKLIHTGKITPIDVGLVNHRNFFLVMGVGFDAVVGKSFDEHHIRGPLPYFYLSAKEFLNYKNEKLQIIVNDQHFTVAPFQLAIANGNQYGNNALIAPSAKLNDGLLNVSLVKRFTFFHLFTRLPGLFSGKIETWPDTEFFTTKRIEIERAEDGIINLDGEPVFEKRNLSISILPDSLKVVTPIQSSGII